MKYRYFYNKEHEDLIYRYDVMTDCIESRSIISPNTNLNDDYNKHIGLDYLIHSRNLIEINKEQANKICKEWYKTKCKK